MIKFGNITKENCRYIKRGIIYYNANQKRSWSWRFIQAIVAELNIKFTPVLCLPVLTVINSKSPERRWASKVSRNETRSNNR